MPEPFTPEFFEYMGPSVYDFSTGKLRLDLAGDAGKYLTIVSEPDKVFDNSGLYIGPKVEKDTASLWWQIDNISEDKSFEFRYCIDTFHLVNTVKEPFTAIEADTRVAWQCNFISSQGMISKPKASASFGIHIPFRDYFRYPNHPYSTKTWLIGIWVIETKVD